MKFKLFNNSLTRVLLICFLALAGIGGLCRNPYTTNPNLRLVVGDTTTDYDSIHCSNPVVSSDGNVIYYLCVDTDSSIDIMGAIYSISVDGSNNKKILDGKFNALAISNDSKKLAVHPNSGSYSMTTPDSLILVLDLTESKVDSYPVPKNNIRDIEFSFDGQSIYYLVENPGFPHKTEIYELHLSDSASQLVLSLDYYVGFDLLMTDSIYIDSIMGYPQINPTQAEYIIGTLGYEWDKFVLRNSVTNKLDTLPDSLVPYSGGTVGYPYWFPNGKDIVFMAKPYHEPAGGCPGEIWILENLFEQIGE